MTSEVLIIGGGVIGLSIARELHKLGAKRITIVEKAVCGEESSWAAAGMLGPQAEADAGGSFFDMTLASRDLYPDFAAELEAETGIDVGLDRSGTLYFAFSDEDVRALRERYEWQNKAGLPVELLTADEARRAEPFASPAVREALFFPGDWQVDNRKLLGAL
ncbi:MAG: FAD-dependent oxidoreductase, partial [Pyrinomonadaceae bacterium]